MPSFKDSKDLPFWKPFCGLCWIAALLGKASTKALKWGLTKPWGCLSSVVNNCLLQGAPLFHRFRGNSGFDFACALRVKSGKKTSKWGLSNAGLSPLSATCAQSKCSKSRDLTAIVICDSNRESQITSDLRHCETSQESSLFWLLVQENGIAILTAIWTQAQITIARFESAIWAVRDSDLGEILAIWVPRFQITSDLRFVIWST